VVRAGLGDAYNGEPSVNTDHEPVETPRMPARFDKLQLNHYYTKSEEEARIKGHRLRPSDGKEHVDLQKDRRLQKTLELLDEVEDTKIHMYLPALKEALALRAGKAVRS
jgi:hypothetical protein